MSKNVQVIILTVMMLPPSFPYQLPLRPLSGSNAAASCQILSAMNGLRARPRARQSLGLSCSEREFPAVPVPPSQVDRVIVPGQRRELHVYDPANVAAVRKASNSDQQFLHVVMDPEALARKEFALCKYGTVLHIVNVKPSVHRTMMGTNVEALLVDVVGTRRAALGDVLRQEPYVAVMAAEANKTREGGATRAGRSVLDNVVDKMEMLYEQCRSVAATLPGLEAQQIPLPMNMPRTPFTYGIGPGEPDPDCYDRPLADLVNEAIALREGDGEIMTKETTLELRATASLQLLTAEVATMALVGLEVAYKKLAAIKALTALKDDGSSWPAL